VPLPNQDPNELHVCRDCTHLQNFHKDQPNPGNGMDELERIAAMYKSKWTPTGSKVSREEAQAEVIGGLQQKSGKGKNTKACTFCVDQR